MASSKVMTTSTTRTTNPDLPRRESSITSFSALMADLQDSSTSSKNTPPVETTMDDLLRNIYPDNAAPTPDKTVDEVWKDIVSGDDRIVNNHVNATVDNTITTATAAAPSTTTVAVSINGNSNTNNGNGGAGGMTLEDFLSRAGAVGAEEEVRAIGYGGIEAAVGVPSQVGAVTVVGGGYGDGRMVVSVGSGRGKRRAVEEPVVDKATQQKQRRMIKNRESAARSRERKQQYTAELESVVTRLEEENARLLKEEAEQMKERFKQLLKNIIPVLESQRPKRALRRVHSMSL